MGLYPDEYDPDDDIERDFDDGLYPMEWTADDERDELEARGYFDDVMA